MAVLIKRGSLKGECIFSFFKKKNQGVIREKDINEQWIKFRPLP